MKSYTRSYALISMKMYGLNFDFTKQSPASQKSS